MPAHAGHPGDMPAQAALTAGDALTGTLPTRPVFDGTTFTPPAPPAAPTIAEAVDNVFAKFDSDANTLITAVEMLKVLDPNGTHTGLTTLVNNIVANLDTDKDGSVSKTELTTAFTALDTDGNGTLDRADHSLVQADIGVPGLIDLMGHGKGPGHGQGHGPDDGGTPPTPPTIAQVVDGAFARFDTDKSTTISLTELLSVLDPKGTHTEHDAELTALFKTLDTNSDNGVSMAELTAAVTALDTDGSGTLTPADHPDGPPADGTIDLIGVLLHGGDGPGHGF